MDNLRRQVFMTCGIYVLKFNGTNKVYVGQSENIEYRYKKHLQRLKRGDHNYKMQQAYKDYGSPILEIVLADLTKEELNSNEYEAFKIYDSISNGFNIAEQPSIHGNGELNPSSKYPNEKIIEVLLLLIDISNTYKQIESLTGVSESTVRHIANQEAHHWLEQKYPLEYEQLRNLKGKRSTGKNTAIDRGIVYPTILSPTGEEYNIANIAAFAKEHGLDSSSLAKVLKKRPKYNSHKGWKLKQT